MTWHFLQGPEAAAWAGACLAGAPSALTVLIPAAAADAARSGAGSGAIAGLSSLASFAVLDPGTASWTTPQRSLLGGAVAFAEIWPRSGTMRAGACWELPTLAPRVADREWLPTPTANGNNQPGSGFDRPCQHYYRKFLREIAGARAEHLTDESPNLARNLARAGGVFSALREWLMGWPLGWSALEPLAADGLAQWRASHGVAS